MLGPLIKEQLATPDIKALKLHQERMKIIGEYWALERDLHKKQYNKKVAARVAALKTKK